MKDLSTFLNESLICESYKDVTGNEFQGIYGGYSAKIYKPGKYIIRLHDFRWEEKCYKDPVLGPICKKMDEFVHLGENKLRLNTANGVDELMDGLEDLILFKDEDLDIFINDLRMLLKNGISLKSDGLTIISLI